MTDAMLTRNSWAAPVVPPSMDLMRTYQKGLPVRLIMTPRKELKTCKIDEPLKNVVDRNEWGFDYFPVEEVRNSSQQIVGLIELPKRGDHTPARSSVREQMQLLCEDNLIGADASILSFVKEADTRSKSCRLVMSGEGIEGLVTLSDLQKFPVRIALFALVAQVEMTMAAAIRREFGDSTQMRWKSRLANKRRQKIEQRRRTAMKADRWVEDLLFTEFADKMNIIAKSPRFKRNNADFENEMKEAKNLRNLLAHANDYADTPKAAVEVSRRVRTIEKWIAFLDGWTPAQAANGGPDQARETASSRTV